MKTKVELEFLLKTNPAFLFPWFTEADKLKEWFAEEVTNNGKSYIFTWEDTQHKAEIEEVKKNMLIRYKWLEEGDYYLEFKFEKSDLSGDLYLMITDFSAEGEQEETQDLWNFHIDQLRTIIGV